MFKGMLIPILSLATSANPLAGQFRTISVGDIDIRYEVTGSGPTVVLLHGWGNDLRSWDLVAPAFAREFTVVRIDRRGFGASGGSPDLSREPGDVAAILDSLSIDRAIIIGHSQGGSAALGFALNQPDRIESLVLLGSNPPSGFGLPWNGPDALPPVGRVAREEGLDAMKAMFDGHPIGNGFVEGTPGDSIMRVMFGDYEGRDLLDPQPSAEATPTPQFRDLRRIAVPTLVVTGEFEMPYFQIASDAMAYGIPGATRVRVAGGGHSVHLQQPDRFSAAVLNFLRSQR